MKIANDSTPELLDMLNGGEQTPCLTCDDKLTAHSIRCRKRFGVGAKRVNGIKEAFLKTTSDDVNELSAVIARELLHLPDYESVRGAIVERMESEMQDCTKASTVSVIYDAAFVAGVLVGMKVGK